MNHIQHKTLRQNHLSIINDLEPMDVLDNLYTDGILTDNDLEFIREEKTRKQRCQCLLILLHKRGSLAYTSFQQALFGHEYFHLGKGLEIGNAEELMQNRNRITNCSRCKPFLPEVDRSSDLFVIFQNHCCLILDNIDPNDIIDYLYQEDTIEMDDYERIRTGTTQRDRCVTMLHVLAKSTKENRVEIFLKSLQKKYEFVYLKIRETTDIKQHIFSNQGINEIDTSTEKSEHRSFMNDNENKAVGNHIEAENLQICQTFPADVNTRKTAGLPNRKSGAMRLNMKRKKRTANSTSDSDNDKCEPVHQRKRRCTKILRFPTAKPVSEGNTNMTFDCMSDLVNNCQYEQFENISLLIRQKFSNNPDVLCIVRYLHASKYLLQGDGNSAKKHIKMGLQLSEKTNNSNYFKLEFFTTITRRYLIMKKFGKLQSALDEAKMIIESDKTGCTGRAAGWLYVNDARATIAQLTAVNIQHLNNRDSYNRLHNMAAVSFRQALDNFERDTSKDKPFGIGFTVCRLVILLMRCGDNGLTMDILSPPEEDVTKAGQYLRQLEESDIIILKSLEVHYFIAKSDYQFRLGNFHRAYEYSNLAYTLATELNMLEFTGHARNRLIYLQTKLPVLEMQNELKLETQTLLQGETNSVDESRVSP